MPKYIVKTVETRRYEASYLVEALTSPGAAERVVARDEDDVSAERHVETKDRTVLEVRRVWDR